MQRILTEREKLILSITIGVIIFSIFFNLMIIPALKRNGLINKEVKITRLKLEKYTRLLSQKEYILGRYNKFTSGLNLSDTGKDSLAAALSQLETFANNADIRILDIRPQGSKNLDLYKEVFIDLRTEGAMEGYLKFLYEIENSLSLLKIKKFQLSAKPNAQTLEGAFSISQLSAEMEPHPD